MFILKVVEGKLESVSWASGRKHPVRRDGGGAGPGSLRGADVDLAVGDGGTVNFTRSALSLAAENCSRFCGEFGCIKGEARQARSWGLRSAEHAAIRGHTIPLADAPLKKWRRGTGKAEETPADVADPALNCPADVLNG